MNDLEQADMLQVLVNEIADTVSNAKREFAEKVNSVMTETYWTIGKYIVEFEQDGNVKAEIWLSIIDEALSPVDIAIRERL